MPGKGKRRREKNYRAAHGADSRLPPPPKLRELEALPSKLRCLIAIQNKQNADANASTSAGGGGAPGKQEIKAGKNKPAKDKETKKRNLEASVDSEAAEIKDNDGPTAKENVKAEESKGNRKRKRGKALDLRFKELEENVSVSKKQKRKKHLDEKKKKRKGNKAETLPDFPGREKVKFGEVVQAPPKLTFPKVKSALDASREMLRKDAIENYRNIKGWTSRPGLQIPALAENTCL
ncbi:hypothetical protein PR202_ga18292 [Eleusine coracana subsp. coracana]|uniref:Uncharacterized protein n=1 Tax=Eleusine coracana subsp. coracana TaxID=191504 RepID=A0AAV5CSZ8_ELECO|nr:hypothetical protein QOZ80_6AG0507190 [Eleusine coracana subsp. coracana]GJN01057.1 hypothetical protein PR202_ga18292 [Eleusine coracana subsp. coracana]